VAHWRGIGGGRGPPTHTHPTPGGWAFPDCGGRCAANHTLCIVGDSLLPWIPNHLPITVPLSCATPTPPTPTPPHTPSGWWWCATPLLLCICLLCTLPLLFRPQTVTVHSQAFMCELHVWLATLRLLHTPTTLPHTPFGGWAIDYSDSSWWWVCVTPPHHPPPHPHTTRSPDPLIAYLVTWVSQLCM